MSVHDECSAERSPKDHREPPSIQGERYEQGERSQQRQYELGDPGAESGKDPFHDVEQLASHSDGTRDTDT